MIEQMVEQTIEQMIDLMMDLIDGLNRNFLTMLSLSLVTMSHSRINSLVSTVEGGGGQLKKLS